MSASYYTSSCNGNTHPNNGPTHIVNGGSIPWVEKQYNHQGGNTYGNMYNCNTERPAFAPGAAYGVDGGCCSKMMHNNMPLYNNGPAASNANAGNGVESFCGNVVDPQQFHNGIGPGNGMIPTMDHERLAHSFNSHGEGNDFSDVYQHHSERYYVAPPPASANANVAIANSNANANVNVNAGYSGYSGYSGLGNVANVVDSGSTKVIGVARSNNNLFLVVAAIVAALAYYGKLGRNNRTVLMASIAAVVILLFVRFE